MTDLHRDHKYAYNNKIDTKERTVAAATSRKLKVISRLVLHSTLLTDSSR